MKLFKDKFFRPDEEIEDLYGPPFDDIIEEADNTQKTDGSAPDDTEEDIHMGPVNEAEMAQTVYGPPSWFSGDKPDGFPVPPPPPRPDPYKKLLSCYNSVRAITDFKPKVALVLGSGLGDFAEKSVDIRCTVDYSQIEGFPISTVPGHKGRFIFGYIGECPVVVMQGRVHYYEGYSMQDVVLPTRLMHMLGAEVLFLTNASGGINASFSAGDFMLITDHISCFVPNPLIGQNIEELGTRFPDMSKVYDPEINEIISDTAIKLGIRIQKGVYLQLTGPSFESPAEIRMLRTFGADAVGMSTVIEAIAARHAGMRICGISCVANLACGMTDNPLTHEEVQASADKAAPKFRALVAGSIENIAKIL